MRRGAIALAIVAVCFSALASRAGADEATVQLDQSVTSLGQRVLVQGDGWPGGALVRVELCGNLALDDSADCVLDGSVSAGVGADGHFSTLLPLTNPPSPCPCVIRVSNASGAIPTVATPIRLVDVPYAAPHSRVPDRGTLLRVENVTVEGHGPWQSWFGGSADRTLVLTVRNVGPVTLTGLDFTATEGKGSNQTAPVPIPPIALLAPGEARVVRVPLKLDAFSWGKYTVTGGVISYGPAAEFRTSTTTYWYGWMIIALALANIVLWKFLRRLANRRERRRMYAGVPSPPDVSGEDEPALT